MNGSNSSEIQLDSSVIRAALEHKKLMRSYRRTLLGTIIGLLAVALIAALITTKCITVLRAYGGSMEPSFSEGDVLVVYNTSDIGAGAVVAFYSDDYLLVKRCVATEGDTVDIDDDGNVYVNGLLLDEPYITEKGLGSCNVELPCVVPEGCFFVLGDNRGVSVDSRNTAVGFVTESEVVGQVVLRVWPLNSFGTLN